jgi:hypothetical protein
VDTFCRPGFAVASLSNFPIYNKDAVGRTPFVALGHRYDDDKQEQDSNADHHDKIIFHCLFILGFDLETECVLYS